MGKMNRQVEEVKEVFCFFDFFDLAVISFSSCPGTSPASLGAGNQARFTGYTSA
jgi:hypothetical protein